MSNVNISFDPDGFDLEEILSYTKGMSVHMEDDTLFISGEEKAVKDLLVKCCPEEFVIRLKSKDKEIVLFDGRSGYPDTDFEEVDVYLD